MTAAWPPPPPPDNGPPPAPSLACYRHPRADAPVTCNRCDRPICTDCMISAPVGWQCPSCVKGGPAVQNMRDIRGGGSLVGERPVVTIGLIAAAVIGFLLQNADPTITDRYGISAYDISAGHLEQLVTAGFLHAGIIHLAFNMLLLFQLGTTLEARLGRIRFAGLFAAGLLGGAMGELLLEPGARAIGASGAVFALMGAVVVLPRTSRFGIERSVGGLLVMNLVITFVIPGIAIGGHLGGLAIGVVVGLAYRVLGDRSDRMSVASGAAFSLVLALVLALAASPVADWAIRNRLS